MKFIIAHISPPGSKNNKSYNNYYIEKCKINTNENMKWNDNKDNTLSIGDYLLFYCWGKRVEIHKIINKTDYTTSPSHWKDKDINNCNVLHLSECLNTYSFTLFKLYEPPYSEYKLGCKKKYVYQLERYPILKNELNRNKEKNKFDIDTKIHHSQLIKNYYNTLTEDGDTWGSNGFISISYRSDSMLSFKNNLFVNVDTICRLIKEENDYLNDKNTLYKVCKLVMDDYKKIILQYCIGTGQEEALFDNSKDLTDAINLFCKDVSKANKKYGNPCNWWSKDWDNYNAGNSYEFSN
jgi:hypothetical protein